jgi:hypothetical protein
VPRSVKYLFATVAVALLLTACRSPEDRNIPPTAKSTNIITDSNRDGLDSQPESGDSLEQMSEGDIEQEFSQGECEGDGPVRLTYAPSSPEDLAYIFPMGFMFGAHVTPVDHQYYYWDNVDAALEDYAVYSPADGYATQVQFMDIDYRLVLEFTCEVYSIFIHLEKLAGPLAELDGQVPNGQSKSVRIPVKAGELIAYDGGTFGFDFSVHDAGVILPGFINPQSYVAELWKIHTVDPYDYFDEPVRSELLAKNIRQAEPLGGKIDHDIPGRLIGNWFVEDTNGYAGISDEKGLVQPDQQIGYWNTHLSIAPDPIDPSAVIVSMGLYDGGTAQFLVKDAIPRPEDVSAQSGLVKYELIDWHYVHAATGEPWGGMNREMATDIIVAQGVGIRGVVLFQMVDDDHLKMEAFPEMGAGEVRGFTDEAMIYER